jgi:ubiquinone/menaquinone biosynthesis C-methylase UbiE
VLELARLWTPADRYPEVTIERADALCLPYPDEAFDVALCSLALHHLSDEDAVTALREMERVTTAGWVVNDLLRDRVACGLIWALTRVVGADPYTRHDAPVSVMRAYTLPEYTELARRAGILQCEARAVPMYRALLVRDKTRR